MQILSFHNNAASPSQGRRFSLLQFNEFGLPPAIEANVGYQTKQFTSQAKFDLGPGGIPDNHFLRVEKHTDLGGVPLLFLTMYLQTFCIISFLVKNHNVYQQQQQIYEYKNFECYTGK